MEELGVGVPAEVREAADVDGVLVAHVGDLGARRDLGAVPPDVDTEVVDADVAPRVGVDGEPAVEVEGVEVAVELDVDTGVDSPADVGGDVEGQVLDRGEVRCKRGVEGTGHGDADHAGHVDGCGDVEWRGDALDTAGEDEARETDLIASAGAEVAGCRDREVDPLGGAVDDVGVDRARQREVGTAHDRAGPGQLGVEHAGPRVPATEPATSASRVAPPSTRMWGDPPVPTSKPPAVPVNARSPPSMRTRP